MKVKLLILYSWFVRTITFFLPEVPFFQAFRGWLYSLGMNDCGNRFRVSFNVVINHLESLKVGDNVYFACGVVLTGAGKISIGSDVLIGPNVILASSRHLYNGQNFLSGYAHGEIIIEEGSWIGGNATILLGSCIRSASVVAAGSVCNDDYKQMNVLIGGMPAKVLKSLAIENV